MQQGHDVKFLSTTTQQQKEAINKSEKQVQCTDDNQKQNTMNYPAVDEIAVDEHDTSIDIF